MELSERLTNRRVDEANLGDRVPIEDRRSRTKQPSRRKELRQDRAGIACDARPVATLEEKVLKRNKRRKWRRMRATARQANAPSAARPPLVRLSGEPAPQDGGAHQHP